MHISNQLIYPWHLLFSGGGGGEASCVDGQTTSPPAAVPTPGSVESIKGKSQMTTSQSELLLLYSVSPYTSNAFVLYGIFSSRFLITS